MADKEATVIIVDVGKNTTEKASPDDKTFFDKSKSCVEKILLRKIFSKPKDEVGLIIMGFKSTQNSLNSTVGGYENICVGFDMALTNWHMLNILEKEIEPSENIADWMDALTVGMDFMKTETTGKKFKSFKIVLLSTFTTPLYDDESLDSIISGLNELNIELVVITNNVEYHAPDVDDDADYDEDGEEAVFSQIPDKPEERVQSEKCLIKILEKTNGALCSFDQAISQLIYFDKKKKRGMPWNCDLEISSHISIKIAAYLSIKEEKAFESWKTESRYGPCKNQTEYFLNDKKFEPNFENLIKGYIYGSTPVPYDESIGIQRKYVSGKKSFKCIGFAEEKYIQDDYFAGGGAWNVVAQKGTDCSERKFTALVRAMRNTNTVMIARYIYRDGTQPKLMALFVKKSQDSRKRACLIMLELFYANNYVSLNLPSLMAEKNKPTEEQLSAVDELLNKLDLTNALDNDNNIVDNDQLLLDKQHIVNEAFPVNKLVNPAIQFMFRAVAQRALNPTLELLKPDDDLTDMLTMPRKLRNDSKDIVVKIKELFPLEVVKKTTTHKLYEKFQNINAMATDDMTLPANENTDEQNAVSETQTSSSSSYNITEIGTVTPTEDFIYLLHNGERFGTLCVQVQNVIGDLVFKTLTIQTEKIHKAIMYYREEAKRLGPFRYNEWINEFKGNLLKRNKLEFWENIIVKERLGLIDNVEAETSTITTDEANAFYTINLGSKIESSAGNDDENVDDLFGDM